MATASNHSPRPPRAAAPPPWSPVDAAPSSPSFVRGPIGNFSSPDPAPIGDTSSPDHCAGEADCSDGNAGRRQVWNKPSNGGAVETVAGAAAVMGAVSWPALSASTTITSRASSSLKSASSDSSPKQQPPLSDPAPASVASQVDLFLRCCVIVWLFAFVCVAVISRTLI